MTKNYYAILGVDKTATAEEIKNFYRKLALRWHPDKFATKGLEERQKANEKMQELNRIYEVLSDQGKRKKYDLLGETDFPVDNSSYDYEEEIRRREEELLKKQGGIIDIQLKILKMEMRALDRSSILNEIGAAFDFTFPKVRKEDLDPNLWHPYGDWMKKVVEMEITIPDGKSRSEELRKFKEEMVGAIKEVEKILKIREENKKRDNINSELNQARTDAFGYIEKEMSEKDLKDEDLGLYTNYREQINNLDKVYKIRVLREEVLGCISKLEKRREPEKRESDYYLPNDRTRGDSHNFYPLREQPRLTNNHNFLDNNQSLRENFLYFPHEPREISPSLNSFQNYELNILKEKVQELEVKIEKKDLKISELKEINDELEKEKNRLQKELSRVSQPEEKSFIQQKIGSLFFNWNK